MQRAAPVLNPRMVDQWFANSGPDEQAGDRKTAGLLRKNVAPRLAKLKANATSLSRPDAERELHSLRGSVGSFGFTACVEQLTDLEHTWGKLTDEERVAGLATACASFDAGMNELFKRFPHLRDKSIGSEEKS